MKPYLVCLIFLYTLCRGQQVVHKSDTEIVRLLVEVSEMNSNLDTITKYCYLSIEAAEIGLKKKNLSQKEIQSLLKSKALAYNNIGYVYTAKNNHTEAYKYYKKSSLLQRQVGDLHGLANSLSNIANTYEHCYDTIRAIQYYEMSITLLEKTPDKVNLATVFANIARIYFDLDSLKKSQAYYTLALKNYEDENDEEGIALSLNDIANTLCARGDTAQALMFYLKSLEYSKKNHFEGAMANSFNELGGIYRNRNEFVKSELNFKAGIVILESRKEWTGLATILRNYSKLLMRQKKYQEAERYARDALEFAKKSGGFANIRDEAQLLCEIYHVTLSKDTSQTCALYAAMNDSIKKEETRKITFFKKCKEELDLYDANFEHSIKLTNDQKKFYWTYYLIFGLSILLIFIIFYKRKNG
ncbi:MAG: tetratricopeptide repeat protein [Bacteroidia bacterium]